ncbi:hypothetical protein CDL15_Pgr005016 [Punica granatum]|uniref:Uncharacterized protein n=1 Tax=Punica granatum TaxID=22663 RepID=A0A218WIA1_PUNGR|nr:hypothetical protein CDL15_Pgr005016 [Punica granatum]
MVLVVLGYVQACFWVPFTCPRIRRPGSPFRKAFANVQECLGLSMRLLKCTRRCHWSFCLCPHVRTFAPGCQVMSSSLSLGPTFLSLEPVDQNGVLTIEMNHTTHLDPLSSALRVSDALFMSLEAQSRQIEITVISGLPKQLRKQSEKSSFGLLGHLRLHIGITGCQHPILVHRLQRQECRAEAQATTHDLATRSERSNMRARTTKEKQESLEKHRRAIRRMDEQGTPKIAEAGRLSAPHFGPPAPTEDFRPKLGTLFTIGKSEANVRAQSHE